MGTNRTPFDKPDDDGYPYDDEQPYCHTCGGKGSSITCCDDICVGGGHCIHGDGEEDCPDCDDL